MHEAKTSNGSSGHRPKLEVNDRASGESLWASQVSGLTTATEFELGVASSVVVLRVQDSTWLDVVRSHLDCLKFMAPLISYSQVRMSSFLLSRS
jgi:hypothetical protein